MNSLFSRAEELGIDIQYDARVSDLLTDEGRVSGVVVEIDGEKQEIQGGSVVLANGSFEADQKKRQKHIGDEWKAAIVRGTEYNTGDGLDMAMAAGAQKFG